LALNLFGFEGGGAINKSKYKTTKIDFYKLTNRNKTND
jgi:hypothetical protein